MKKIVTLNQESYYYCGEYIDGRYYRGVYGGEMFEGNSKFIKVDNEWIAWGNESIYFENVK
jgi:hypothetical protein